MAAKNLSSHNGRLLVKLGKNLEGFYSNSYITDNDYEILMAFGKYLGSTDKQDQIKNIN